MAGRTRNTFLNAGANFVVLMAQTILTFVGRTIFIKILGENYLGLNGLFSNILSMLSLAELGIGTAINFSLYKPISTKDTKKISKLMSFYKRTYRLIGVGIFVVGLLLMPFLHLLNNSPVEFNNLYLIYIIFLVDTVLSYFVTYKETLINADQKRYKIAWIETIGLISSNVLRIALLLITRSYIAYLLVNVIVLFVQRFAINRYISKKYKEIDFTLKEKLDEEDSTTIKKNVKALFFHKIGDYCVNGTDNIIISAFIDIGMVGIYSNYLMITTTLNSFVVTMFNGVIAALGNVVASESEKKQLKIFERTNFVAFILYGTIAVGLSSVLNLFITLWLGEDYVLSLVTTLLIVINFYVTGMRVPCYAMKSASGLFDQDKFSPLLQAFVNLVVSIALVRPLGVTGVIIGTLVSGFALPVWQRPYLIYKYIFKTSSRRYFIQYIKYAIVLATAIFVNTIILDVLALPNAWYSFIIGGSISCFVFGMLVVMLFFRSPQFKYLLALIKKIVRRKYD